MTRKPLDLSEGYPEDYHDYVIKDGKLVGAFDEMYRHAKDVPWGQDERCNHWYAETGLLMLRDEGPFDSILEIGAGLGYFTEKVRRIAGAENGAVHAFDISVEAARRAATLHPAIEFWSDDIMRRDFVPRRTYELVIVRDVFWYVFDELDQVIANVARLVEQAGKLYLSQSFPNLERPFVGKEVIPNPDALLAHFTKDFSLIHSIRLQRHRVTNDGPILQVLLERSA